MTVAAAIPRKPNSRNKKILNNVFKVTVTIEKFNGSLEFSFAKKIGVKIFTKIKLSGPKKKLSVPLRNCEWKHYQMHPFQIKTR